MVIPQAGPCAGQRRDHQCPLGERVLPHAGMALSAARSVEQIAAEATGTMTGTVRLAATPTVCQGLVEGHPLPSGSH
ncbi:hypothetical protein [Streptomyces sp. bgisy084]|uniref:hypothetical protein n=1 Tax=unclassified Streptomyces TaxID=2593676 RepID=UPI003D74BB9D